MTAANLQPTSNIPNKVRNTRLPKTKVLMPLFEVISNSIHAIEEAKSAGTLKTDGVIKITLIRNGLQETLAGMIQVDEYPINSFVVIDNGIGLNDYNLSCFVESDTDHKVEIGGKGVGRFICLKAFENLHITSKFLDGDSMKAREFTFTNRKDSFQGFKESDLSTNGSTGTTITLSKYRDQYQKFVPKPLALVVSEIITHFQLYFIRGQAPSIIVENQNGDFIDCQKFFKTNFTEKIQNKEFNVGENTFTVYITKPRNVLSHKINFCAHNRTVREEGLFNRIPDLGKYSLGDDQGKFYYQAFVVGDVLDENVDLERVGFTFPTEEEETEDNELGLPEELTLSKIRNGAINTIEELLADYLDDVRNKKVDSYRPIIQNELPQYNHLVNHKAEEVKRLAPNLTKEKLDVELYKIETNWKVEVKNEGIKILGEKKDIQNLDEYKKQYEKFLADFNEVGKADLARYVVHRRSVIQLLEKLIEKNEENRFYDEDIIHSIFFPIRTSGDEVPHDKQNLWLIDERLTYHSFLASDKRFNQIKQLESSSSDRTDLLIYNDALAFAEDKLAPFHSFTIVEFKKPQREGYEDFDPKKNPISQVEKYIEDLRAGTVTGRNGRKITVDPKMPFYVYIVCDITDSLRQILHSREFDKTPDGQGYFKFYTKYYNAYVEVLPFEKVLSDARKRNRILFEKLGVPQ